MKNYQISAEHRDRTLVFKILAVNLKEALKRGERAAMDAFIYVYGNTWKWKDGDSKLRVLELDENE